MQWQRGDKSAECGHQHFLPHDAIGLDIVSWIWCQSIERTFWLPTHEILAFVYGAELCQPFCKLIGLLCFVQLTQYHVRAAYKWIATTEWSHQCTRPGFWVLPAGFSWLFTVLYFVAPANGNWITTPLIAAHRRMLALALRHHNLVVCQQNEYFRRLKLDLTHQVTRLSPRVFSVKNVLWKIQRVRVWALLNKARYAFAPP